MGVFFEIESSLIKEVVKAVSNFNEESIFIFDSDGLFVRLSDLNRFKILELSLNLVLLAQNARTLEAS